MTAASLLLLLSGCTGSGTGSPSDSSISMGLDWLARHQSPDGHWGSETFRRACVGEGCGGATVEGVILRDSTSHDVGVTSLALLAFRAAGRIPEGWSSAVKRGADWLMAQQDAEGCFGRFEEKYLYEHCLAMLALCEMSQEREGSRLKPAAKRALRFLMGVQSPGAGWRFTGGGRESDSSVTAWAVLALGSAARAGLEVPKGCYEGALAWYASVTELQGEGTRTGYIVKRDYTGPGMKRFMRNLEFDTHPTLDACACLSAWIAGKKRDAIAALDFIAADLPSSSKNSVDSYYWFFGTCALRSCEGPERVRWRSWKIALERALEGTQEREGCGRGSWDPREERWFAYGGERVYTTAMNVLTLELLGGSAGISVIGPGER